MGTTPSRRLRALLVLFSFGVAALLGEVALRVVAVRLPVPFLIYLNAELKTAETWQRVREWLPALNIRQDDPEIGWTFKPNLTLTGKNEDGEPYEATTSPQGFFTPDQPEKNLPQLVTVGASFLSTFYVRRPLEHVVRAATGMPVYNLSAGGWGPENFHAAYAKFAADRRRDVVLVFTTASDMAIVNNWNIWRAEGASESFLTWTQRSAATDDSVNRGRSWPDRYLMLWNLAKFATRRAAPAKPPGADPFSAPVAPADVGKRERFVNGATAFELQLNRGQLFMENDPAAFFPGGAYYPYMQAYFESLARMKARIERDRARMVLVWIPLKERVYLPLLSAERWAAYVTSQSQDIAGLEQAVARFAAQEGISFLDLTPGLSERAGLGEKLYFTVDGHFNSLGNEVAVALVADFVKGLPPHSPEPGGDGPPLYFRRGPVPVERPLQPAEMSYRAAIVEQDGSKWAARGKAEARFASLAQWPVATIGEPRWLIATGVVRRGGLTVGLLKDDKWELQFNITNRGPFNIALPVAVPGQYVGVIASNLPEDSLETDIEISSFGWAPIVITTPKASP